LGIAFSDANILCFSIIKSGFFAYVICKTIKTEITWISNVPVTDNMNITFNTELMNFMTSTKDFGVCVQGDPCWDEQSKAAIKRGMKCLKPVSS